MCPLFFKGVTILFQSIGESSIKPESSVETQEKSRRTTLKVNKPAAKKEEITTDESNVSQDVILNPNALNPVALLTPKLKLKSNQEIKHDDLQKSSEDELLELLNRPQDESTPIDKIPSVVSQSKENRNHDNSHRNQNHHRNQNNNHHNKHELDQNTEHVTNVNNQNEDECRDNSGLTNNLPEHLKNFELSEFSMKSISELREIGDVYGVNLNGIIQKQQIIHAILRKIIFIPEITLTFDGVLEVLEDNGGFGFLRSPKTNYNPSNNDVYVPIHIIKKYNLETGHSIYCTIRQQSNNKKGEKYYPLDKILKINGKDATNNDVLNGIKERRHFDELIPSYPEERYKLENFKVNEQDNLVCRIIDLMSPIGKGQRALIVAPPRTGKTVLLKTVANSISIQYPKVKLMMLLIDERPEEVTDMRQSIKGEVISSTFDESPDNHIHVAEMVLEKAKRLVEDGEDVVIIIDSVTRLARAYNTVAPSSGKVLTGGIDSGALQRPKRWFGAARNIKGSGSLTIVGSVLVETGSRMDDVIFEEFKGTGNCEMVLDRRIAERRIFPAIDLLKSGTRKEELLMSQSELQRVWLLRRVLTSLNPSEATELLRDKILGTKTNEDFLSSLGNS